MMRGRGLQEVSASAVNSRRQSEGPSRVQKKAASSRKSMGSSRKSLGSSQQVGNSRKSLGMSRRSVGPGRESLGFGSTAPSRLSMSMGTGRASLGGGRHSMGGQGKSRRSSIHAASTAAQDPRPLTDPEFRTQCTRNLIEFLTQNGYGHAMSPKILQAPSDQTFFQIFQFLYHKIDPEFQFSELASVSKRKSGVGGRKEAMKATASMVEQVPMLLKNLCYPFKINKSGFICIGSTSNWPKMLGVLHFLLEIATLQETVDINAYIFSEDVVGGNPFEDEIGNDKVERNEMMFEYMSEAYCAFLAGDDEMKGQLDEEMLSEFNSTNEQLEEKLAEVLADNETKKAAVEAQHGTVSDMPALMQKASQEKSDIAQFQKLIANLEGYLAKINTKIEAQTSEHQLRVNERAGYVAEQTRLQDLYDTQELTPADVEQITQAKSQLDKDMEAVLARKAGLEERKWKQESAVNALHDEAQKMVVEYNSRAEQLHLLPAESRIAGGVDFELHLNSASTQPNQPLVLNEVKGALLPALSQLKETLNDAVHNTNSDRLTHEAVREQKAELVAEASGLNQAASRKLAGEEDRYAQSKQAMASEEVAWGESITTLQEQAILLEEQIGVAQGKSSQTSKANAAALQRMVESMMQEKEEMNTLIEETVELISEHRNKCDTAAKEYSMVVSSCK